MAALKPDLLFLDVQMPGESGMDLLGSLEPPVPHVIFTTAYDEFAVKAFEVNALDYLLKPVDAGRFDAMLARAREAMKAEPRGVYASRWLVTDRDRSYFVPTASIDWIEADRNYVSIRVGKDNFHARSTLQQAETALRSQPMLRISRSCLVNMNYVKEVNRTLRGDFILVLSGGATVTSSEGFRGKVKEYLGTLRIS